MIPTMESDTGFPPVAPLQSTMPRPRRSSRLSTRAAGEILVGRYQVERVVSRTAREVVLQARHLELGQRVMVRHLTLEASASPEAVQRFQRGARRARELRSEHAERIVDFGRLESGAPYRASELPLGPSLAEILRVRGALPPAEAVDLVVGACEPIAEAHAAGMIHRSLSTACIFVERRADESALVRVLDFGVADPLEPDWMSQEETAVTSAKLTESLPYASPEQVRSSALVDARSDVWALGAILYELLAGEPLFQADGPLPLLAMISADAPTPLDMLRRDIPAELEAIVMSCLEKDPEARPRSVVELALALAPFGTGEAQPAAARVARVVTRTTRPPAFPSATTSLPPFSSRPSALMRTRPPRPAATQAVTVQESNARSFTMLAVGAALGVGAAVATALLTRPAAPVAATEGAAPKVVQQAAPVAVAPVASAALPAAPAPVQPAPLPRVRRVSAPRPAADDERAANQTATANAKDLFSGLE
jgi:eukaryotic-like serine/threonine-protein kinase